MSGFVLKVIACIAMFCGHLPFANGSLAIPFIFIGRLAFPIFAFLISEGYVHTKSFKKYLTRLIVLALISQLPAYLLFFNSFSDLYLNIYFTLALGLISIRVYDKVKNKYASFIMIFILAFLAQISGCDFGAIGVLMILFFFITKNHNRAFLILSQFVLMVLLFVDDFTLYPLTIERIFYYGTNLVVTISSLILIVLYNGKRGKNSKQIQLGFYLFYPIHLILLCLIKYFI